jgi:hypothetical protein
MQWWLNICKLVNIMQHINRIKDKNHMIITIDAEKAFDKVYHSFMIKALLKIEKEGPYRNIMKAIYDKPIANIVQFPLKSRMRQGFPLFLLLFNI